MTYFQSDQIGAEVSYYKWEKVLRTVLIFHSQDYFHWSFGQILSPELLKKIDASLQSFQKKDIFERKRESKVVDQSQQLDLLYSSEESVDAKPISESEEESAIVATQPQKKKTDAETDAETDDELIPIKRKRDAEPEELAISSQPQKKKPKCAKREMEMLQKLTIKRLKKMMRNHSLDDKSLKKNPTKNELIKFLVDRLSDIEIRKECCDSSLSEEY